MMVLLQFPQNLMDHVKGWRSLQGLVAMFMLLSMISKGPACEAPSSPQCFKRHSKQNFYTCEWNTSMSNVTYNLYFNTTEGPFIEQECEDADQNLKLPEEKLIKNRPVYIWVTAHTGKSSCTSPRTTMTLRNTVKYEAPRNLSVSWLNSNLSLHWQAVEMQPASVEVKFRKEKDTTGSWEIRSLQTNTPNETLIYRVIVVNLQKHSAYQVQVRQKSTQASNALWSDWSPVHTVPAVLEQSPDINMNISEFENGTRILMLTWKPVPHAAAVGGVTYSLTDTQSSRDCPCLRKKKKKEKHVKTSKTEYRIYVTNSFVNISVSAINAAGTSPPANIVVPAKTAKGLETACKKPLRRGKVPKHTCLEWYELQDGNVRPETVNTLRAREKYNVTGKMKDYVPYFHLKHECVDRIPKTVEMCLFYLKEDVPRVKPLDFMAHSKTLYSAGLSWTAIPSEDQRGYLTHYILCSKKTSPQPETEECHKVSKSQTEFLLENLIPGAKYNITLAGVTRVGVGPNATLTINTGPGKPVDVWLSIGLLLAFFFASVMCTFILKRLQHKIFPPVPKPVIRPSASYPPENQEMLEVKEEVDEITLQLLEPEAKPDQTTEDLEEAAILGGVWEIGDATEDEVEDERILGDAVTPEGSCNESLSPGYKHQAPRNSNDLEMSELGQGDSEIPVVIYKNGSVFDVKPDCT